MKNKIKKFALFSVKLMFAFVMLGASFQFLSTMADEHHFPFPGKLVDMGGFRMHIHTTGTNGPTVILESGLGCSSLDWSLVQPELAKFATVISYDRAGYGWSDHSPSHRTSEQIVKELHTLLEKEEVKGPYILVGHSFGGINVRLFASYYPQEVSGIVLVDAAHEDQVAKLPQIPQSLIMKFMFERYTALIGIPRILYQTLYRNAYDGRLKSFSDEFKALYMAKNTATKVYQTVYEELLNFEESTKQLKERCTKKLNTPLVVISAGQQFEHPDASIDYLQALYKGWMKLQADLVNKSTKGRQLFAKRSGHMILWDEPEIIIQAVKDMISSEKPVPKK